MNIQKHSSDRPLSPDEKIIASYLAGKGLYSGLQLKHLMSDAGKEVEEPEVLKLKLPKSRIQKMSNEKVKEITNIDTNNPVMKTLRHKYMPNHVTGLASSLMGGFAGFNDASSLHEKLENEHYKHELANAEKEYLDALTKVKVGSDNTPNLDAFCRGIVNTISKTSEEIEKKAKDDMADNSIKRVIGKIISPVTNKLKPIKDTAKAVTFGIPLTSALAVYMLKNKQKQESEPAKPPTTVELVPS